MRFAACVLLVSVFVSPALAQAPASAALTWTRGPGAEQCPSSDEIRQSVERILQRSVFTDASDPDLAVRGSIDPGDDGWRVRVELSDASGDMGQRDIVIEGSDCAAVNDSVALVVALAVDSVVQTTTPVRIQASPRPAGWSAELSAEGVFALGLIARTGFGGGLAARVAPPGMWSGELRFNVWQLPDVGESNQGAELFGWGGALGLCATYLRLTGADMSACLGGRADFIKADGFGFPRNDTDEGFLLSATANTSLAWRPISNLVLRLTLGANAPIARQIVVYEDIDGQRITLKKPWPVGPEARLSVGLRIP